MLRKLFALALILCLFATACGNSTGKNQQVRDLEATIVALQAQQNARHVDNPNVPVQTQAQPVSAKQAANTAATNTPYTMQRQYTDPQGYLSFTLLDGPWVGRKYQTSQLDNPTVANGEVIIFYVKITANLPAISSAGAKNYPYFFSPSDFSYCSYHDKNSGLSVANWNDSSLLSDQITLDLSGIRLGTGLKFNKPGESLDVFLACDIKPSFGSAVWDITLSNSPNAIYIPVRWQILSGLAPSENTPAGDLTADVTRSFKTVGAPIR